jgi:hypothetical protein
MTGEARRIVLDAGFHRVGVAAAARAPAADRLAEWIRRGFAGSGLSRAIVGAASGPAARRGRLPRAVPSQRRPPRETCGAAAHVAIALTNDHNTNPV